MTHDVHGPRAREDQPAPGGRGARARTASTRCPPSTRRSASATTSPRPARPGGASASRCRTGWTPTWCPSTGDNIVDRAARLLADHHGIDATAEVSIAKTIPVAGGHGRRLRRRGGRPGRARPAVGRRHAARTCCGRGRARQRRPVRAARRHRPRHRPRRAGRARLDDATWWWVAVLDAEGLSTPAVYRHFDGSTRTPTRTPPGRRRPARRARAGDVHELGGDLRNDLQPAALRPAARPGRRPRPRRARAARSAASSPARARPACSSPTADAARAVAGAFTEDGARGCWSTHGPVAGAHVVTYV